MRRKRIKKCFNDFSIFPHLFDSCLNDLNAKLQNNNQIIDNNILLQKQNFKVSNQKVLVWNYLVTKENKNYLQKVQIK